MRKREKSAMYSRNLKSMSAWLAPLSIAALLAFVFGCDPGPAWDDQPAPDAPEFEVPVEPEAPEPEAPEPDPEPVPWPEG